MLDCGAEALGLDTPPLKAAEAERLVSGRGGGGGGVKRLEGATLGMFLTAIINS